MMVYIAMQNYMESIHSHFLSSVRHCDNDVIYKIQATDTFCSFSVSSPLPCTGSTRTLGGKLVLYLSPLTGQELAILIICSLTFHNQKDQPYWAKSGATLIPVVFTLLALQVKLIRQKAVQCNQSPYSIRCNHLDMLNTEEIFGAWSLQAQSFSSERSFHGYTAFVVTT